MLKTMNPNLQSAILEFLANEFHLDSQKISPDLNFQTDLHLTPEQFSLLLSHMQDALNFILPEDKSENIITVSDLFTAIAEAEEEGISYGSAD